MKLNDGIQVLFVGLKLTGHINWEWWWVLAPFWGGCLLRAVIKSAFPSFWETISKKD